MRNHYRIMGNWQGNTEEIDCVDPNYNDGDPEEEARRLRAEYQLAFGPNWTVWVEVQTFNKYGVLDDCFSLD